jgi:membrane-bound metal-dependent hydrolase YbcI (DUF457 family)
VALAADALIPSVRRHRPLVGVLDASAHLAVGLLVARVRPREERAGVLAGSLVIDLDHAPSELGHEWLRTGGRGRPYPHTLLTILPALVLRGPFWRGAAVGLAAHFARDLTDPTTGVRLLWPLSRREHNLPWPVYPLAVGALAAR